MENHFVPQYLEISLGRRNDKIEISINSELTGNRWKEQLYINENRLSNDLLSTWKRISTKKLKSLSVSFDEIDWYDDLTDIYETPHVVMRRGLRKPVVGSYSHGSIPKAWGITVSGILENTTTKTPIIDVVRSTIGYKFTTEHEKKFTKELKKFLKKENSYFNYYFDTES